MPLDVSSGLLEQLRPQLVVPHGKASALEGPGPKVIDLFFSLAKPSTVRTHLLASGAVTSLSRRARSFQDVIDLGSVDLSVQSARFSIALGSVRRVLTLKLVFLCNSNIMYLSISHRDSW